MRLNKDIQYALLLVFYIGRAGRASIETAASNLKLPKKFLYQIARKLRIGGVLNSCKGPSGGYELTSQDVTIRHVIESIEPQLLIYGKELDKYLFGDSDHRALAFLVSELATELNKHLDRKMKDVEAKFVNYELTILNKLNNMVSLVN